MVDGYLCLQKATCQVSTDKVQIFCIFKCIIYLDLKAQRKIKSTMTYKFFRLSELTRASFLELLQWIGKCYYFQGELHDCY